MWQFTKSAVYLVQIYAVMLLLGVLFAPWAALAPRGARVACKTWCWWALSTAQWMVGLRGEIRGDVPTDEVMIAAKHQSFFDIMLIFYHVPKAKFIMKRELLWTPIIGLYAKRIGCVPVDRGKRGQAIRQMVIDVEAGRAEAGQLIIYPQGTRVAPGATLAYKAGTAALYQTLGQPCVPAATNVGLFWPRRGILRNPGVGTVEFLDRVEPGLDTDAFMHDLEDRIETRSNALMAEVGFHGVRGQY